MRSDCAPLGNNPDEHGLIVSVAGMPLERGGLARVSRDWTYSGQAHLLSIGFSPAYFAFEPAIPPTQRWLAAHA